MALKTTVWRWLQRTGSVLIVIVLVSVMLPAPAAAAATGTFDPNADGTIGAGWGSTAFNTNYFDTVNEATRQPTMPNVLDYFSSANNNTNPIFLQMATLSGVGAVTSLQVWLYHNDGAGGMLNIQLYNAAETVAYGSEQAVTARTANTWDSVTFSGLSLSQAQLDGLRIRTRITKTGVTAATAYVAALYATATYTSPVLSVDVVDGSGNPVASPGAVLSSLESRFACQTATGAITAASDSIRVNNTTANGNWTASIAASAGATARWSNGSVQYDFNDSGGSPAGCGDGADADNQAGQLSLNPAAATLTPQSGCSSAGVTKGASAAFVEGTVNAVTLMSASSSQVACYYDLSGVAVSQKVPAETPASVTPYALPLVITVTAN